MMRVFLVPVGWYYLKHVHDDPIHRLYLVFIGAGMVLSDFLDGYLARKLGQETPLGQYLDPIADKIAILTVLSMMVAYLEYPLWIVIFIFAREIVGIWGGAFLLIKKNILGKPNYWGKWGVTVIAFSAIAYIIDMPYKEYTPWLALAVLIGGIGAYANTYWKTVFGSKGDDEKEN